MNVYKKRKHKKMKAGRKRKLRVRGATKTKLVGTSEIQRSYLWKRKGSEIRGEERVQGKEGTRDDARLSSGLRKQRGQGGGESGVRRWGNRAQ